VVLGLGRFGTAVARRLTENEQRVAGVDGDEAAVAAIQDELYEAIVADVTDREVIRNLNVNEAEAVFISLGASTERSIMAALHCVELGAPRIFARSVGEEHGRVLSKLGVTHVIAPEQQVAVQLADRVTWPDVLRRQDLGANHSLVELTAPGSLAGKTLRESNLRSEYGVQVVGVREPGGEQFDFVPDPDTELTKGAVLLVIARNERLQAFTELE
jgi:trk system potassium uptake protein TrkA